MNRSNPEPRHPNPEDPALEALLDEALAPAPAPRGLADRITAATTPRLRARQRPVLARIGWRPALRIAAAIAVAGAVLLIAWPDPAPTSTGTDAGALAQLDTLQSQAEAAEAIEFTGFEAIDYRMEMLDVQLALADTADPWTDDGQALDDLGVEMGIEFYFDDASELF